MESGTEVFLPILFGVLAGFVALNILINFVLLYIRRQRINLLLSLYWPLVLVVFIAQSQFQTGNLAVALAYSVSLPPMMVISTIGFEIAGQRFPLRRYLLLSAAAFPLTLMFALRDYRFEIVAAPFALLTALITSHTGWRILVLDRGRTTKLQKLFGIVSFIMSIHCINFALFRMAPGAQLWGWLVTYAIYDAQAIVLPSIALENAYMTERKRLQAQIRERTADLALSLDENRALLKILLHDIRNPLGSMGLYLQGWRPADKEGREVAGGLRAVHANLEEIVGGVKGRDHRSPESQAILPQDCCRELQALFARALEAKQVRLTFRSTLPPHTCVRMDYGLFLHSVLGNLVGNALKFSPPGGTIAVTAREEDGRVIVEVRDQGEGMPVETIERLNRGLPLESTAGSAGEAGSGMGLSIVKSLLQSHGGTLEVEAGPPETSSRAGGTTARILIAKAAESTPPAPAVPAA